MRIASNRMMSKRSFEVIEMGDLDFKELPINESRSNIPSSLGYSRWRSHDQPMLLGLKNKMDIG